MGLGALEADGRGSAPRTAQPRGRRAETRARPCGRKKPQRGGRCSGADPSPKALSDSRPPEARDSPAARHHLHQY